VPQVLRKDLKSEKANMDTFAYVCMYIHMYVHQWVCVGDP